MTTRREDLVDALRVLANVLSEAGLDVHADYATTTATRVESRDPDARRYLRGLNRTLADLGADPDGFHDAFMHEWGLANSLDWDSDEAI